MFFSSGELTCIQHENNTETESTDSYFHSTLHALWACSATVLLLPLLLHHAHSTLLGVSSGPAVKFTCFVFRLFQQTVFPCLVLSLTFIPLFTCILTDSQSILLLACSCLSLFSAALLLLSIIPSGRTALLIMQHIILLASLSRELLCRLGSRIWSQATGLFTASLHNKRVRESEGGKELERDMVAWPVR